MKVLFASAIVACALTVSVPAAEVSVKLSAVHLCCAGCVKGVQAAAGEVQGVTASADQDEGTVSLGGPDAATLQKAVDAVVAAGYFGKSSDAAIKVGADTGAKDQKVQSLQLEGVHLCCGKCVKAVTEALNSVTGVKANTAAKGAKTFTVTGDFNDKEVLAALHKAGFAGKVGR